MTEKISQWTKFKRFLKRNMTPTWAKHVTYQVFAFVVSVAMIVGVADYAVTKSYDERKLSFVEEEKSIDENSLWSHLSETILGTSVRSRDVK